jgi:hypothetical protein
MVEPWEQLAEKTASFSRFGLARTGLTLCCGFLDVGIGVLPLAQ